MRIFEELEIVITVGVIAVTVKVTEVEEEWGGDEFGTWTGIAFKKSYWLPDNVEFTDHEYDEFSDAIRDEIKAILR